MVSLMDMAEQLAETIIRNQQLEARLAASKTKTEVMQLMSEVTGLVGELNETVRLLEQRVSELEQRP